MGGAVTSFPKVQCPRCLAFENLIHQFLFKQTTIKLPCLRLLWATQELNRHRLRACSNSLGKGKEGKMGGSKGRKVGKRKVRDFGYMVFRKIISFASKNISLTPKLPVWAGSIPVIKMFNEHPQRGALRHKETWKGIKRRLLTQTKYYSVTMERCLGLIT